MKVYTNFHFHFHFHFPSHSLVESRVNSIYSFIGSFSPVQDTDATKQQTIHNIHDAAEVYRQSIQNALVTTSNEESDEVTVAKSRSGVKMP